MFATGARFNRWTILSRSRPHPAVLARCDCGTERVVYLRHLETGRSRSCGCWKREVTARRSTKHGGCGTPVYRTWKAMLTRCTNPRIKNFHRYGGRGITVCARWRRFVAFRDDMGPKPSPLYSLDRIDNSKGYEPGNVRWATKKTQNNNRANNHRLSVCGRSWTLAEWSAFARLSPGAITHRIRRGWAPEQAVGLAPPPSTPADSPEAIFYAAARAALLAMLRAERRQS